MPKKSSLLTFLALILLCLPAISPFMKDGFLITDDGFLHLYRAVALDYSFQVDGSIYPRFASGLVYGYGAPLFNFYPVASYYPIVVLHGIGLPWLVAWKGTLALYTILAAIGSYLLGKVWTNRLGGFVAAAAYVYSPYALFDLVIRGTSTEFAAMALLPFTLWGFSLLAKHGGRRDFLTATLSFFLFSLMHTVMTLFGTVFIAGFCAVLLMTEKDKFRLLWQMALAGILALGMSAFFWLPALAETQFVKINGVTESLDFINVSASLRSLGEVFELPHTADPSQLQAPIPIVYSWLSLAFALIGVVFALRQKSKRWITFYLLGFFIVTVYMQTESSAWLWDSVSLLRYSQFEWRVMSLGSLALALLAAFGVYEILERVKQDAIKLIILGISLVGLMLYSFSWLYQASIPFSIESILDVQRHEIETNSLALSSYSEYLPIWNTSPPDPSRFENFPLDTVPKRLQANEDILLLEQTWHGTSAELEIEANQETELVFNWLYFVGWQAEVDEQAVEVFPFGEEGLVTVNIPAGQHSISIRYAGTNAQFIAYGISLAAFLGIVIAAYFWRSPSRERDEIPINSYYVLMVIRLALGLFLFKTFLVDVVNNPFRTTRFENGQLLGVEYPQRVNFNQELLFLGSNLEESGISGDSLEVQLYWTAIANISNDYSTKLQLRDEQGNLIAETGSFYPADLATSNWREGFYLEEEIELFIPDYTIPKSYTLYLSLYESETGRLLDIFNESANPIAVEMLIGTISVQVPSQQSAYEETPIASMNGMRLLEFSGLPETAQVGDEIRFYWLWRKEDTTAQDGAILRFEGTATSDIGFESLAQNFSFDNWLVGEVWRSYQSFYLPADLAAGAYSLSMVHGQWNFALEQSILVTVPERNFDLPTPQVSLEAAWQNGIQLLGYDLLEEENRIVLFWQTENLMDESLRLFVQVLDENGQVLSLSDSIPMDWLRPTTSWIQGEVIRTEHLMSHLGDDTRIIVGWYRPQTGERLLLSSGEDALSIPR